MGTSGSISAHIISFYPWIAGQPIVYCKISEVELRSFHAFNPDDINFEHQVSSTGDECHHNIHGIKDKDSDKFVRHHFKSPNIFILCKGSEYSITNEQYEDLERVMKDCKN